MDEIEKQPLFKIKRRMNMIETKIVQIPYDKTAAGETIVQRWEMIHTRKLDRMLFKNAMKHARTGRVSKMCKHSYSGATQHEKTRNPSWFAEHWKEVRNVAK